MSGKKHATVAISENMYTRLRDMGKKEQLEQVRDEAANQQTDLAIRQSFEEMKDRQTDFEHLISSFDGKIRDLEQDTSRRFYEHYEGVCQSIENASKEQRQNTISLLDEQAASFEKGLLEESRKRKAQFADVEERLTSMQDMQRGKEKLAESWLVAVDSLESFIVDTYDYQKFFPGELEKYAREIDQAYDLLSQGVPEAVLANVPRLYSGLSDLRIALEKKMVEWELLYQGVYDYVQQLYAMVNANATVPALDLDGNKLETPIDVDYWVGGELSELAWRLEEILNILDTRAREIGIKWLQSMQKKTLPDIDAALGEIVYQARVEVLNSQLRMNVADMVIKALEQQGFFLQIANYREDDMRSAFAASVKNYEGNEVVIQVVPKGNGIGDNELEIESHDSAQRTEHELRQRAKEISGTLVKNGLQVGNLLSEAEPVYSNYSTGSMGTRTVRENQSQYQSLRR